MQITNIEESDYNFFVTITTEIAEDLELKQIACNVALPKEVEGEISLQFFFTRQQLDQLESKKVWMFSADGERKEASLTYQKIIAKNIAPLKTKQIHDDLYVIEGEPRTLYVENEWSFQNPQPIKPVVKFQLTPSRFLEPIRSMGDKENYLRQASMKLNDGTTVVFDHQEYIYKDESGKSITANALLARCENLESGNQEYVQNLSDLLDDILLLTSFVEARRCTSLGWNVYDHQKNGLYFRRDRSIPQYEGDFWFDCRIELDDFDEFLQTAYENFLDLEFKPSLRRAINSLIKTRETLESEFISLYAGLESLVLGFRRIQGMEFVFTNKNEREKFQKELKSWVKTESFLKEDEYKDKRVLIYENVSALQRISFGRAYRAMLEFYDVDLNDLWNVTSAGSLSTIRNRLVHGETFVKPAIHNDLVVAKEHLKWTLERLIFAILGWKITKTKVSKTKLGIMTSYHDWEKSRKIFLHKYF